MHNLRASQSESPPLTSQINAGVSRVKTSWNTQDEFNSTSHIVKVASTLFVSCPPKTGAVSACLSLSVSVSVLSCLLCLSVSAGETLSFFFFLSLSFPLSQTAAFWVCCKLAPLVSHLRLSRIASLCLIFISPSHDLWALSPWRQHHIHPCEERGQRSDMSFAPSSISTCNPFFVVSCTDGCHGCSASSLNCLPQHPAGCLLLPSS